MNHYDIEIAVRVYPGRGSFCTSEAETKLDCFVNNMRSLCDALAQVHSKLHIVFDACDDSFISTVGELITGYGIDYEPIVVNVRSNPDTFRLQQSILRKSNAPLVLLLEDDYYIDNDAITELVKFASQDAYRSFYSGFNSSDYSSSPLHSYHKLSQKSGGREWRSVASTTFSFACSPRKLIEYEDLFSTFSEDNNDYSIWLAITKKFPSTKKLIFSTAFTYYAKRIIKLLRFSGSYLLRRPSRLWVINPGTMHHMDSRAPSQENKDK